MDNTKMTFAEACGKIRQREIEKEVSLEAGSEAYNNRKAFRNCAHRAKAFGLKADEVEGNFRAYTFVLNALSKKEKHNLSQLEVSALEEEKTDLIAVMAEYPEDIAMAEQGISIYSWWRS